MEIEPNEWTGKNVLRFLYGGDHDACRTAAKLLIAAPDQAQKLVLRKQTGTGFLSTQWDIILLRDEAQKPTEVLCIGYDITTLIKKQESLQHLLDLTKTQNKRLQEFTYIVSHNIRSHVANLSGIVHGLDMDDKKDRDYSMELLKISIGALDHTIHYLNEIVSIQESQELPLKTLDVNEEIEKTLLILQSQIDDSGAKVVSSIPAGTQLKSNPAYFESILLNLLTNAIKYRAKERVPEITVAIVRQGDYDVLSFRDNGIGLDLGNMKDQLFKIFNTFNHNKDAQGMGLYITKTQAEAMGGKIEVESQLGEGSLFSVYFMAAS
jgi:light-regulated signal transduction histidine kinase (bacteriophytochrome)